jgi:hypothetical protein
MPSHSKLKAFIGSSVDGLERARAIQEELRGDLECTIWNQGTFQPGKTQIEALSKAVTEHHFAIFIFVPEDFATLKDHSSEKVRDNVLFQLGLFIGKLGRDRSFFVVPEGEQQIPIAASLAGVTPGTYNPNNSDLQTAVSSACFQIRKSVKTLAEESAILYNSGPIFKSYHFTGIQGHNWVNKQKVGNQAQGFLSFEEDGTIRIERINSDGRYELHLRHNGPKKYSFKRKNDPVFRELEVSCDTKVDVGEHTLRFLLKDEEADEWTAKWETKIVAKEWVKIKCILLAPTTVDVLLRIDDMSVSQVPSSVYVRNLKVVEVGLLGATSR